MSTQGISLLFDIAEYKQLCYIIFPKDVFDDKYTNHNVVTQVSKNIQKCLIEKVVKIPTPCLNMRNRTIVRSLWFSEWVDSKGTRNYCSSYVHHSFGVLMYDEINGFLETLFGAMHALGCTPLDHAELETVKAHFQHTNYMEIRFVDNVNEKPKMVLVCSFMKRMQYVEVKQETIYHRMLGTPFQRKGKFKYILLNNVNMKCLGFFLDQPLSFYY